MHLYCRYPVFSMWSCFAHQYRMPLVPWCKLQKRYLVDAIFLCKRSATKQRQNAAKWWFAKKVQPACNIIQWDYINRASHFGFRLFYFTILPLDSQFHYGNKKSSSHYFHNIQPSNIPIEWHCPNYCSYFILSGKRSMEMATHILQFVFHSCEGKFQFPYAYYPTAKLSGSTLFDMYWDGVAGLLHYGFDAHMGLCDGGQCNRTFITLHFDSEEDAIAKDFTTTNPINDQKHVFMMDPSVSIPYSYVIDQSSICQLDLSWKP